MNENAIKNYATWARRELMSEVERRCALYGISDDKDCPYDAESVGGRVLSSEERRMRRELVGDAKRGMSALVERAAYTWFNRMLAIRFMECNDRLPSRTRMFSAADGSFAPQALKEALSVEIDGIDRQHVASLVQDGDDEALFRYLLLLQCDELADCMPAVFDKVGEDPLVLLLPDGLLRSEGVIGKLVSDITEDDWRDGVQIVGWMYQFYISEKKDEFFASKRKASAEDIPAATQLFTPEWIVQYLVQNSLGRLWVLNRPGSRLAERMEYFIVPEADAHEEFQHVSSPEEITLIDPACGSGHILVYAFDLLAAIYEECGYSRRDVPRLILEKNLTGVEIDHRAGALASFALTMKACEYDSRFLRRGIRPKITVLEKIELGQEHLDAINQVRVAQTRLGEPFLLDQVDLLDALAHLDEAGSLFVPSDEDMSALRAAARELESSQGLFGMSAGELVEDTLAQLEPLHACYSVVVANPPYMGSGKFSPWMGSFTKKNYPISRIDICTCFIERVLTLTIGHGYAALVGTQTWLTNSRFSGLRERLIADYTLLSLAHIFDNRKHAENFSANTMFVLKNDDGGAEGVFFRLSQMGDDAKSAALKDAMINQQDYVYTRNAKRFASVPGFPIAYWASDVFLSTFTERLLGSYGITSKGLITGDNDSFFRFWWELSNSKIMFDAETVYSAEQSGKEWFPLNKGGSYRKWFGNHDYVIQYSNQGENIFKHAKATGHHAQDYDNKLKFTENITWSDVTSGNPSFRYRNNELADHCGMVFSPTEKSLLYFIGLLNSSVIERYLAILAPTIHLNIGELERIPVLPVMGADQKNVEELTLDCIELARTDWDAFEGSWNFNVHPLIGWSYALWDVTSIGATMYHFYGGHPKVGSPLELCYMLWQGQCRERFDRLKSNEEELNRIFARIYGMESEVPVEVPEDKVSVRLADKTRDIKSLISYAVGCMLGRYSLDVEGLVLANQGDGLVEYLAKVPEPTFMPDDDGIIPITDTEYFHDDATGFFVDFVRTAYGEDSLEENLAFVADALGGSGTPRESIREYFMNGFFADHCKTYQKKPIYWLFDSGKKGGFRAIVYMHRYKPDLLAKLRTDYVHEQQDRYRTQIEHIDDALETADRRQQAELKKRRKKLSEQLAEIGDFEEKVHHLADQMIEIDLDDGVKANYAKFQDVLAKIK